MSNQNIKSNPTLHDMNTTAQNPTQSKSPLPQVFKLGLDVDLKNILVAIQCGQGAMSRESVKVKSLHYLSDAARR